MIKIPLTRGYYAHIDEEDYHLIKDFKWLAFNGRNTMYAARQTRDTKGKCKTIFMHRIILSTPEGLYTDHIDGNGLNNTRANLRMATAIQNSTNKIKKWGNCIYRGIVYLKKENKYKAKIMHNRKEIHIGRFDTALEAAKAYDKKSLELNGEFAALNFPKGSL